ncbi:MAG TPA: YtxH domain-containing protein [Bryobacteraceae bacterium]|jgi:gas vesicle protein|nr:YtxH domain-containing protein [Bryobacteraceae bacterium]
MASGDNGSNLGWFVLGAAVGAAVALLYAPQSGRDTRQLIARKTEESREAIVDSSKEALDRGKELFERGRELADEAAEIFERGRKLVRG